MDRQILTYVSFWELTTISGIKDGDGVIEVKRTSFYKEEEAMNVFNTLVLMATGIFPTFQNALEYIPILQERGMYIDLRFISIPYEINVSMNPGRTDE